MAKTWIRLHVLIACEESQAECTAFRELGHDAWSCDLQKCRRGGHPEWHIIGDCVPLMYGLHRFRTQDGISHAVPGWDLIIAHPPCTFLCKIGSPWLYRDADHIILWRGKEIVINYERYKNMIRGRAFFLKCLGAKAPYVAVENPLPMALAQLPRPSTYVCPSWFGSPYTKKTLYWLKNLPPIIAQQIDGHRGSLVKHTRGKYRSRTDENLARAIAKQWSDFIICDYGRRENRWWEI